MQVKEGDVTVAVEKEKVLKRSALAYSLLFLVRRLALIIVVTIFQEYLFV